MEKTDRRAEVGYQPAKKRTQSDIDQQKHFAIGCAVLAAFVLGKFAFTRSRTLRANGEALHTTDGRRVPFANVFRVDRRKWTHKGLAFVHYRDENGIERRAVIDDLKYVGADQILDRLMEHCTGEVIDLEDAALATDDSSSSPPPASAAT